MPKNAQAVRRGEIIRAARTAKGFRQENIAKMVGVSKAAFSLWEAGKVNTIALDHAVNLSVILDIPMHELLTDDLWQRVSAGVRLAEMAEGQKSGLSADAYRLAVVWDRLPAGNPIKDLAVAAVDYVGRTDSGKA